MSFKNLNRGALQISFAWLFAIIVGAFVLFLAIYGVGKLVKSEGGVQSAQTSKEIGILLNPLETGFEELIATTISFPVETRIFNSCSDFGNFGTQRIRVEQMNFGEWTETDLEVEFKNKYIFSENPVEGEIFYVFSKPFDFPFKVNDLVYITSSERNYCFTGEIPEDIEDEIEDIGQPNLFLEECPQESVQVCFGGLGSCEINVDYELGLVEKLNENPVYFEGDALMYAAIFSDSEIYECQLKRTLKRTEQLTTLYIDKEILMSNVCDSGMSSLLLNFESSLSSFENSEGLYNSASIAESLGKSNGGKCNLW